MSLIEKIDAEIAERQNKAFICAYNMEVEKGKSHNQGEIKGLELARQIILSEQKEPCEYCGKVDFVNDHGNTFYISMINSEETEEYVYILRTKEGNYELVMSGTDVKTIKISHCPVCGRPLNQPIES